jgi:hypothetical protein
LQVEKYKSQNCYSVFICGDKILLPSFFYFSLLSHAIIKFTFPKIPKKKMTKRVFICLVLSGDLRRALFPFWLYHLEKWWLVCMLKGHLILTSSVVLQTLLFSVIISHSVFCLLPLLSSTLAISLFGVLSFFASLF